MSNPKHSARSNDATALTPDTVGDELSGVRLQSDGDIGPVPAANRPGSRSGPVQDKPDMDAFAARFGLVEEPEDEAVGGSIPSSQPSGGAQRTPDEARAGLLGGPVGRVAQVAVGTIGIAAGAAALVWRRAQVERRRITRLVPGR